MTLEHGLRTVNGKPDVKSKACMQNCETLDRITSVYPDSARNSHGNIQLQNRTFGAVRGVDTSLPAATSLEESISRYKNSSLSNEKDAISSAELEMQTLAKNNNCLGCHGVKEKLIGPGFNEIAAKYKTDKNANTMLVKRVKQGTSGNWGDMAMPPQTSVSDADAKTLVNWILKGN